MRNKIVIALAFLVLLCGSVSSTTIPTTFFSPSGPIWTYDTGNQTANITVTTSSGGWWVGTPENMVNGSLTQTNSYFTSFFLDGTQWLDFAYATPKNVTEATLYKSQPIAGGNWQWQGSNDGVSYTNIGAAFLLTGSTAVMTSLSGNVATYTHYRMLSVSGASDGSSWVYQWQFETRKP